jgi:hypothetical protein
MIAEGAYSIALEGEQIVVRLKAGALDRDSVARFLEYLELESIRRRSRMTAEQATTLANEIDKSVWDKVRGPIK